MAEGNKSMEVDTSDGSACNAQSSKEKHLIATPVSGGSSGEGLPYAPEGWPCPGDIWGWKAGNKRTTNSGYWHDRYIYAPPRLSPTSKRPKFKSKVSLKDYIQKKFPEADVDAFFSSFIWSIPSTDAVPGKDVDKSTITHVKTRKVDSNGYSKSNADVVTEECKAGNKICSLRSKENSYALAAGPCDMCCTDTGFCPDCRCILCCKSVEWGKDSCSFIRCEARVGENFVCGHVAHLYCALRAYLAGTVGGSIGLDAEYYCRRCDNRTDLLLHVSKIIKACESLSPKDDVEKLLHLGLCILRDSKKEKARFLRNQIEMVMAKLKRGVKVGNTWKKEDNASIITAENIQILGCGATILGAVGSSCGTNQTLNYNNGAIPSETARVPVFITSDHDDMSVKVEDEVDGVLRKFKKSQESDFRLIEQKLFEQKNNLLSLYQHLEKERSELASVNGNDYNHLLDSVLKRVEQVKREEMKLQKMMKVADGLSRTPRTVLVEYFGFPVNDD